MKILHLIDSFEFNANTRQLQTLGPATRIGDAAIEICCLGANTPALEALRRHGILAHALSWTRWFDPSVLFHLRSLIHESTPDVIHVWGLPALRTLAVVAADWLGRVVMSGGPTSTRALPWWDRRLLEQIPCITVAGESDRQRLLAAGVAPPQLHVMPPSLESLPASAARESGASIQIGCIEGSHRHAIWGFDFVRLLFPTATLHLVGARQSEHATIVDGLDCTPFIHFLDDRLNVSATLDRFDVVWVPSLTDHGRQTALDAMARGKPIVASDVPCLREMIDDGETGFLVTPGDVVPLARRTRMLLEDAALRDRLGRAAQARVAQRFPLARTIDCWTNLYRRVAA